MAEDRGKDTSDRLKERLRQIEACCRGRLRHLGSELHGLRHLREVALLAGRIAAEAGVDVEAAMVGGFLHDCGRTDDGGGRRHALDSADKPLPLCSQQSFLPVSALTIRFAGAICCRKKAIRRLMLHRWEQRRRRRQPGRP